MSVSADLRAWANSTNHQAPPAWVGDRGSGHSPGDGDRLLSETPRRREWVSTAYGFDALGRVQQGADPHELVRHVFDNRLNALGLAEWLDRGGKGSFTVEFLLRKMVEVGGGD